MAAPVHTVTSSLRSRRGCRQPWQQCPTSLFCRCRCFTAHPAPAREATASSSAMPSPISSRCMASSIASTGERKARRPQPPPTATPAHVLRRLPPNTPVPRIASSVKRVVDSYELSASLQVSCSRLSSREMMDEKKAVMSAHTRGAVVEPESWRCRVCGRLIGNEPPRLEEPPDSTDSTTAGSVAGSDASDGGGHSLAAQARGQSALPRAGIMLRGRGAVHLLCHERDERFKRPARKASSSPSGD
mmetsp:Transcript_78982/g.235389  ORF Transcript_78982/g.235389 Transcript_78982/m.235389 type:complete len:245 (-) Transcript_78982:75-809(-)